MRLQLHPAPQTSQEVLDDRPLHRRKPVDTSATADPVHGRALAPSTGTGTVVTYAGKTKSYAR